MYEQKYITFVVIPWTNWFGRSRSNVMLEHVMTRKILEQIRKQHTAYYKHNKLHKTLQYNYYEITINYLTYNKPYKLIKGTKRIEERKR